MNNKQKSRGVWLIKAMNYESYYKTERGVKTEGEGLTNFWFGKVTHFSPTIHAPCTASDLASCLEGSPFSWLFASINYPFNHP